MSATPDPPGSATGSTPPADPAVCYRHPDREAHIRCVRCERRICPDCMIPASVGFQCPECVKEGNKTLRQARTPFGGQVTADPGWVSKGLIGVTVVMYVLQQAVPGFTDRFAEVGLALGDQGRLVGVADGEVYRLLTAAFLHGSVLHIGLNMYALYIFGPQVEALVGRVRFASIYLVAALGGNALSYAFSAPNRPSLGASGAVFGVLGAYLVLNRRLGRETASVLGLLAINVVFAFVVKNIDWRAHLGGLIAGALCAAALAYAPESRRPVWQVAGMVATLLLAVAVVVWRTTVLRG